jgi:sigma54-dependent transcription regulator
VTSPTSFKEIYPAAVNAVEDVLTRYGAGADLTYHLSPGTSVMAAVWAILAKTRFPAELVQSTREQGVQTASLPFEMSPDFIPDLLRVLQEGKVTRIGESKARPVSVRIIAATNRDLMREVAAGHFREDLFHRLAVAVLKVPPLRERQADIGILIDHLLEQINRDAANQPGYELKRLSDAASSLLLRHPWPGNVRELYNTLLRASIWSTGPVITPEDARDALLPGSEERVGVLDRPLGSGFDIREVLADVAGHYLHRALAEAHGNKTAAAELVGLPSYQTLTNWMRRFRLEQADAKELPSPGGSEKKGKQKRLPREMRNE